MGPFGESSHIETQTIQVARVVDFGVIFEPNPEHGFGAILGHPGAWVIRSGRRGCWIYPINDDADLYGAGSSGPAVPASSGLTAPDSNSINAVSFSIRARVCV